MSRTVWIIGVSLALGLASCGGSDSGTTPGGLSDREAIQQAAEDYFVLDRTPDAAGYCTSYISLQRDEPFNHGDLTEAAERTESSCRRGFERFGNQIDKTGWPRAEIQSIEIRKSDRAFVEATWVERGRDTSRRAWAGKVADGDWRILNAGYD